MMIHLMHPQTAARQQRHCTGLSEGSFSHTANSLCAAATSQATQRAAGTPLLEVPEAGLDGALGNLIWWGATSSQQRVGSR